MFPSLPLSPKDPIYAIAEEARKAGPEAINATIGIFMDEDGKPLVFESVRKAVADIASNLTTRSYGYRHLLGLPEYRKAVGSLLDPTGTLLMASIATTGGTGAVALNLRLAKLMYPGITAILPVPAWPNYRRLLPDARIDTQEVPHVREGKADAHGILTILAEATKPMLVILQVGCHNPTGLDLTSSEWAAVADAMKSSGSVALLDFAYQGFAGTPEEDAFPIRLFAEAAIPTLIAWSASKNHSIYSERAGLAACLVPDEPTKANVENHYCILTRSIHSGSATLGQEVVRVVQETYKEEWLGDLEAARQTLRAKRDLLRQKLPGDLRGTLQGNGMFAMLPLSKNEIEELKRKQNVFLTGDGRINVAGIPMKRLEEFCGKVSNVHT